MLGLAAVAGGAGVLDHPAATSLGVQMASVGALGPARFCPGRALTTGGSDRLDRYRNENVIAHVDSHSCAWRGQADPSSATIEQIRGLVKGGDFRSIG